MPIAVDLTELPMEVRQKMHWALTDDHAAEIVQARLRQQKIAKFYADNQPRSVEGIGGLEMAIDPFFVGYFNMMHGRQVWHDPDFRKWLCKQEEAFRVRSTGTKVQVGYSGIASASKRTFRKSYPAETPNSKHQTSNRLLTSAAT